MTLAHLSIAVVVVYFSAILACYIRHLMVMRGMEKKYNRLRQYKYWRK